VLTELETLEVHLQPTKIVLAMLLLREGNPEQPRRHVRYIDG
jgi:hypothetical protein